MLADSARKVRSALAFRIAFRKTIIGLVALSGLLLVGATQVAGQTYLQAQGASRSTTTLLVENGWVDASSGRLHLAIPLGSYPQRAGRKDDVALVYDSNIWTLSSTSWQPGGAWTWGGWRLVTSGDVGGVTYTHTRTGYITYCLGSPYYDYRYDNYSNFVWTAPDGTPHSFPISVRYDGCADTYTSGTAYSSDGSGYYMVADGINLATEVLAPDGTTIFHWGSALGINIDSNGNYYVGNGTDTLGRVPVTTTASGNTVSEKVLNSIGGTSPYTITTASITVSTNFAVGAQTNYAGSLTVMQSLQLPDNTTYTFKYDCDPTASGNNSTICGSPSGQGGYNGGLKSMTLPTGGQITYGWNVFQDALGNKYPWINQRVTSDGAWNYAEQTVNTCSAGQVNCQQTFTVTKPNSDSTVYTFALNGGAWPTQIVSNDHTAGLLSTTNKCYTFVTVTSGQCTYTVATASPATSVSLTWETTTVPIPGGTNLNKTTSYTTDPNYGNIQNVLEWNYYTGTLPTTADRTTTTYYQNAAAYVNANILDRPSTVQVTDKNSNFVSKTNYAYDEAQPLNASGYANHDDVNYPSTDWTRGNATSIHRLVSGTSNYLTTSMTYDMTGQVKTSVDSKGNVTQFDYTDNFYTDPGDGQNPTTKSVTPSTNAYLKAITYPTVNSVTLTKTFGYFWGTGQIALSTDENSNISYFHFYDSLNRPTSTALPNSEWTRFVYNSTETQVDAYTGTTNSSASTSCTVCRHDQTILDSIGRVSSNRLVNDPDGESYVDTTYDSNGRVATVSNPYRGIQNGVETPSYDGLDRTTQVKHADNNIGHTYFGASVGTGGGATSQLCSSSTYGLGYPLLVVDEAGNKRQTWTDGFGRVIETDEPGSSGSLTVGTCYTYDLNNKLTQVTSLGLTQTRKPSYTYDMLSRITSKSPTESSGTTNFYYTTSSGALCSGDPTEVCRRTDARSITTTYVYDALNRLTTKTYSDGTLTAYYYYDQSAPWGYSLHNYKGRMTSMGTYTGTSWKALSCLDYDTLGHVSHKSDQVVVGSNAITEDIYYTYNLDGSIATIKYPSGRTVTYTEGNAQRMTSAVDTANNINYVTSPTSPTVMYAPSGGPQNLIFGKTGTFNGISEIRAYNNRLEVTGIEATSSAGTPLNLTYNYVSGNNGNISQQTNNATSGRSQSYTYDSLNRLLTAQTQATSGGDCWGQSFGNNGPPPTLAADALANLFYTTVTKCSAPQPRFTMNTSNNDQFTVTPIAYDSNGDMTAELANPSTTYTYTYDAENRISSVSGMAGGPYCYTYDVFGVRVMKTHANGGSCTGTVTVDMLYWRNTAGNTIAETDGTGSTTNSSYNEYVFFAGRRAAQSNPSLGYVYYYFVDHLGSTRVVTNATGTACYEADFLPYGAENTPSGFSNICSTRYRFTGYERDSETAGGTSAGNDYAFARYYNQRLQRFMSGDPLDGDISDPQTLNQYAYVRDNPINRTDPLGMEDGDYGTRSACEQVGFCGPPPGIICSIFRSVCSRVRGQRPIVKKPPKKWPKGCPSDLAQKVYAALIAATDPASEAEGTASALAQLTGNAVIVGISAAGTVGIWDALGLSAGVAVGIAVDPSGNVGLASSVRGSGGFTGLSTGGTGGGIMANVTFTRQKTIFGLAGNSPVLGISAGDVFGGSISGSPTSGSVTVAGGLASGISTFGGVTQTTVIALVCQQ